MKIAGVFTIQNVQNAANKGVNTGVTRNSEGESVSGLTCVLATVVADGFRDTIICTVNTGDPHSSLKMADTVFGDVAYCQMFLHAMEYPHRVVNSVFLAGKRSTVVLLII